MHLHLPACVCECEKSGGMCVCVCVFFFVNWVNGCASRSDDKRLFGFPVKEYKKGRGEKSTQARTRRRGERKRAERDIPDQSVGTRVGKNRAA